jgi:hypothetical protein
MRRRSLSDTATRSGTADKFGSKTMGEENSLPDISPVDAAKKRNDLTELLEVLRRFKTEHWTTILILMFVTASSVWWFATRNISEKLEAKDIEIRTRENELRAKDVEIKAARFEEQQKVQGELIARNEKIEARDRELMELRRAPQAVIDKLVAENKDTRQLIERTRDELRQVAIQRSAQGALDRTLRVLDQDLALKSARLNQFDAGPPGKFLPTVEAAPFNPLQLQTFLELYSAFRDKHKGDDDDSEFFKPFIGARFEWTAVVGEMSGGQYNSLKVSVTWPSKQWTSGKQPYFPCYFDINDTDTNMRMTRLNGAPIVITGVMGLGYLAKCKVVSGLLPWK